MRGCYHTRWKVVNTSDIAEITLTLHCMINLGDRSKRTSLAAINWHIIIAICMMQPARQAGTIQSGVTGLANPSMGFRLSRRVMFSGSLYRRGQLRSLTCASWPGAAAKSGVAEHADDANVPFHIKLVEFCW